MTKTGFVPVPETREFESEHFRWDVNFPEYVPEEQIGVNIGRIERLARLGGIEHTRISCKIGEITSHEVEIVGVQDDGTAIAGKSGKADKASLSETVVEGRKRDSSFGIGFPEYEWGDAQVKINTVEIANRIMKNDWDLRHPTSWTHHLNKGIAKGLRAAGKEQLYDGLSSDDRGFGYLYLVGLPLFELIFNNANMGIATEHVVGAGH